MPNNNKPKLNLEKLVGQFKIGAALETRSPLIMSYAFDEYNMNDEDQKTLKDYIKNTLASGSKDFNIETYFNGLYEVYEENISKATISEIKQISDKLGYKVPDVSNLISEGTVYGKLKDDIKVIKRKIEDDKNYKPDEKDKKTLRAGYVIDSIFNLCKEKNLTRYKEKELNELINKK